MVNGLIEVNDKPSIQAINIEGSLNWKNLNRKKTGKVTFDKFSAKFVDGDIKGSGYIQDFNKMNLSVDVDGSMGIKTLAENFLNASVSISSGKINFKTQLSGSLKKVIAQEDLSGFTTLKSKGDITISNLTFTSPQFKDAFENINGTIIFDNKVVLLNSFTGTVNSTKFSLKGYAKDYIQSLTHGKEVNITAEVAMEELRLEEFLQNTNTGKGQEDYLFQLPKNISLSLNFKINAFSFRKFNAKDVVGKAILKNQTLQLKGLKMNTCGGKSLLSATIRANVPSKVFIESKIKLIDIDVKRMFTEVENFGQSYLRASHLRGVLNTTVAFKCVTDGYLNVKDETILARADIQLDNGELSNFESFVDLEEFLSDEFHINMSLSDLKFNTLKNVINISDKVIRIPEMKIASNGINLDLTGTHSFENKINYLFKIKTGEIFKAKKQNKIDEKYGVVDNNDQTSTLPLLMSGTVDSPKFSYDVKAKKTIIKKNWVMEGKTIKDALQNEIKEVFGKEDENKKPVKTKTTIKVVWDEEE